MSGVESSNPFFQGQSGLCLQSFWVSQPGQVERLQRTRISGEESTVKTTHLVEGKIEETGNFRERMAVRRKFGLHVGVPITQAKNLESDESLSTL